MKRSIIGEKYPVSPRMVYWVTSVAHFRPGAAAAKSRASTLGAMPEASPVGRRHLRGGQRPASPSARMRARTALALTASPSAWSCAVMRRYP